MNIRKSWIVQTPIAHRGYHTQDIPENSLGAFENAILRDFAIELDIRLTDDNELVVFHDESLTRMTNSDGYISNINSSELKNYKLLGTDYSIPLLSEVLEHVDGKTPLLIEIKNSGKVGNIEDKLLKILNDYKGDFAIQSFNPYSLEFFKFNAPGILRGQLSSHFDKSELTFFKRYMLKRLKLNNVSKPDFISYNAEYLPNKYVSKTGLPVLAWTVRSNAEMERALMVSDNIIFEKFIPIITKDRSYQ